MSKDDKRARIKAWKEQQRQQAKASLPLDDEAFEQLFAYVAASLAERGCDHSRRSTEEWLRQNGGHVAVVGAWLDENSGFCDCEVVANAEEKWRWAAGRE